MYCFNYSTYQINSIKTKAHYSYDLIVNTYDFSLKKPFVSNFNAVFSSFPSKKTILLYIYNLSNSSLTTRNAGPNLQFILAC